MKVVDFSGGDKDEKERAADLEQMKRELPHALAVYEERSKLRFQVYQQHMKAGFTKEEAYTMVLTEVREGVL